MAESRAQNSMISGQVLAVQYPGVSEKYSDEKMVGWREMKAEGDKTRLQYPSSITSRRL